MEKINIAELLMDCPEGMELDCTLCDSDAKVFLERVLDDDFIYPIRVTIKYDNTEYSKSFTKYGAFINDMPYCKCVIFPKGKDTWEGFTPPHQFKDGDICYIKTEDIENIFIFKGFTYDFINRYVNLCNDNLITYNGSVCKITSIKEFRLATEEEKEKLFDVIRENGYKWNFENKTLEKLINPKFKVGDRIAEIGGSKKGEIIYIDLDKYHVAVSNNIGIDVLFKDQDDWELVNDNFESKSISPKFKEGDRIVLKDNPYNMPSLKIKTVTNELYILEEGFFYITSADERYVLENKFNINDLKPFDRVLVRYDSDSVWIAQLFEAYDKTHNWPILCVGHTRYKQCIPYKDNEHLLGTTKDCDNFYKWEED